MEHGNMYHRILDPIRRLQRPGVVAAVEGRQQHKNKLTITYAPDTDHQSVQYLADFLSGDTTHGVTELELTDFALARPPDGGLNVLCELFARSDTSLSKVKLRHCDFGDTEDASRLLSSFQTTNVTDLLICGIKNLEGVALGTCLSALLYGQRIGPETVRAFQPGLQSNQTLKELRLSGCQIGDEGIRLIVDALVTNETLEMLDIRSNSISRRGLPDITRLLEYAVLKEILVGGNDDALNDNAATRRFGHVLSENESLNTLEFAFNSEIHPATAGILFTALESNSTLEEMNLGRFSQPLQCLGHLIASLPRMKGIKRLNLQHGYLDYGCTNHAEFMAKRHQNMEDLVYCILNASPPFLPALHQNTSLEVLPGLETNSFLSEVSEHVDAVMAINNILDRNRDIHRADLLLALQPQTGMPIASKSGIWYKAMAKMVGSGKDEVQTDDDDDESRGNDSYAVTYTGASAVFMILQRRPAILEKQLRRPAAIAASCTASQNGESTRPSRQHNSPANGGGGGGVSANNAEEAGAFGGRKRQRLL